MGSLLLNTNFVPIFAVFLQANPVLFDFRVWFSVFYKRVHTYRLPNGGELVAPIVGAHWRSRVQGSNSPGRRVPATLAFQLFVIIQGLVCMLGCPGARADKGLHNLWLGHRVSLLYISSHNGGSSARALLKRRVHLVM